MSLSPQSLRHKRLAVTLLLGRGIFAKPEFDSIRLDGPLRASATAVFTGGPEMCDLDIKIYGMSFSHMNAFATCGPVLDAGQKKNEIIVEAAEGDGTFGTVFRGRVTSAWADFSGQPQNIMVVQAHADVLTALKPIPPTSINGVADVATVIKELALADGKLFENNDVVAKVSDQYLVGTAWSQIATIAAAGIPPTSWLLDGQTNTFAIWPEGKARGGVVPVIGEGGIGMVGYPTFSATGIEFDCAYDPTLSFGRVIKTISTLPGASGFFRITGLTHLLESEMPNGRWFSHVMAQPLDGGPVLPRRIT